MHFVSFFDQQSVVSDSFLVWVPVPVIFSHSLQILYVNLCTDWYCKNALVIKSDICCLSCEGKQEWGLLRFIAPNRGKGLIREGVHIWEWDT